MARTLIGLVVGALFGATVTVLLTPAPLELAELGDPQSSVVAVVSAAEAAVSAAAIEGGPAFYHRLADANASELAAMIRQAAAEPSSPDRELALAMLLKRYAEIDVLGAVRLARETGVGGTALGPVYGEWARTAPAQALAALSTVENPDAAAAVATALISTLGNDAAAVTRVAAVLAARENEEQSAGITPMTPAAAVSFAPRSALGLAAQRWSDLDPRRALDVARNLHDERLRLTLESAALRALARIAPDEAFSRFAAAANDPQQVAVLAGALAELARADPERLLASVSRAPQELRRLALSAALPPLSERDPATAGHYLESVTGPERLSFQQLVARNYGKRDPVAALAWARSMPEPTYLVVAVIGGVAEQDLDGALDLALELTAPNERMQAVQSVAKLSARDDATAQAIADRLLTSDDQRLRGVLTVTVVPAWAARSPDGLMRWLLADADRMDPSVFIRAGQQLATRDPRVAIAHSAQIPASSRQQWMQGIAQGYAENDPKGAVHWLAQYRGEPWYGDTVKAITTTVADRDGAAAATLIDELDAERDGAPSYLVNEVATNWARRDPTAAAAWALERSSEQERATAVRSVVAAWSSKDAAAARQWMLRLPQGEARDGALATVLVAIAFRETRLDTGLLNAFTSDSARQQAVLKIVKGWANNYPASARAAIEGYLTDPSLRSEGERMLGLPRNDSGRAPVFSED